MASDFGVRKLIFAVSLLPFLLLGIAVVRTVILSINQPHEKPCSASDLDFISANNQVLGRFIRALRFETVSRSQEDQNYEELRKYRDFIISAYPSVFSSPLVKYDIINGYSILIHVQGSNSALMPYMIASHLDVVPASNESWKFPPFEGRIKDGYIYGRGTLDCKNGVMASLEALDFLLKSGHKPMRSFYLAYGHDEEVSGNSGAGHINTLLKSRNVKLKFIIDEGLPIVNGVLPGLNKPYALIGVGEKGYMEVKLATKDIGGHASMPPPETSVGILAKAVTRLESNPMKSVFGQGPEASMLESLAPDMGILHQFLFCNLWLFSPLVGWFMSLKPNTNAFVRTTTAVTMFNAGIKTNVIPTKAEAVINLRIHPANNPDQVLSHIVSTINDARVAVTALIIKKPAPVSPWGEGSFGYQVVRKSVKQVFPNVGVAPGLMIANTDTMHYLELTDSIYRFLPSFLTPEDLKRIHGYNERIAVDNYEKTINYFYHLMINADSEYSVHPPKTEL